MHQIALNFEDGITRFIDIKSDETVADAAYRQGINIPLDCRDGACGTCKCLAESGQYELGNEFIEDALSVDEAAQGYVLTCQMRVSSDCVIQVPVSAHVCKAQQSTYRASISALQPLNDSTFRLVLSGAELSSLAFLPGQYVNVRVPSTDQARSYSFSSLIKNGEVSFLLRNLPGGLMSRFLSEQAQVGDELELSGPLGSFYLRDIQRPLLMLAGGTGLAPFMAMLEKIAQQGSAYPIHLIYGVSNDQELVEVDYLDAMVQRLENFSFQVCVANPQSQHPNKGYVTRYMEPARLNQGDVDIYLCGPPAMVEAVGGFLSDQGVVPSHFYYEKFAATR